MEAHGSKSSSSLGPPREVADRIDGPVLDGEERPTEIFPESMLKAVGVPVNMIYQKLSSSAMKCLRAFASMYIQRYHLGQIETHWQGTDKLHSQQIQFRYSMQDTHTSPKVSKYKLGFYHYLRKLESMFCDLYEISLT